MLHELAAAWWAARRLAAPPSTPLRQDSRPPTCDISGPMQKAPRDVRHAKLHHLERLRRMVAVQRRDLIDPR
jgi:hypothetical protein